MTTQILASIERDDWEWRQTKTCMIREFRMPRQPLQKPSFGAPWKVGDAVVGRGNARWTTLKSGHICPCQNCSQRPPAEKTGRLSLLNRPSCPPDDPIGQGTELNWPDYLVHTECVFLAELYLTHPWHCRATIPAATMMASIKQLDEREKN